LPGHGTRIEDLHRSRWQDWAETVEAEYGVLKARCHEVFVGGESLGGLLALYLGSCYPEVAGLVLYAPALYAGNRLAILAPLLKYIVKTRAKQRKSAKSRLVDEGWQGYMQDSLPAVSQVLRLQRFVRRRLPLVRQPLLVFQGRLDETIDPHGAEEIIRRAGSTEKQLVWLEASSHCLLLDCEWETAAQATVAFIDHHSSIERVGNYNKDYPELSQV
jgi:carboxylesterase